MAEWATRNRREPEEWLVGKGSFDSAPYGRYAQDDTMRGSWMGYPPPPLFLQIRQNKGVAARMVRKILSVWDLEVNSSRIRTYGMSWLIEDMPEAGRLARAAVALESACGLVGEERQASLVPFDGYRKGSLDGAIGRGSRRCVTRKWLVDRG